MKTTSNLGVVIGSGQVAKHVPHLMGFYSQEFINLNRNQTQQLLSSFSSALDPLKAINEFAVPQGVEVSAKTTEITFYLAVKDDQISDVYQQIFDAFKSVSTYKVSYIHFSGSLYLPEVMGIHPLMTFASGSQYPEELYANIPLHCDHKELAERYSYRLRYMSPEKKPLYHALCVMMGNFPQMLIYKVAQELPEDFRLEDFVYLITYSIKNVLDRGFEGLSGPYVRKDMDTILRHKSTLEGNSLKNTHDILSELFLKEVIHA